MGEFPKDATRNAQLKHSSEAKENARTFVKLLLRWSADDDERARRLLAKCWGSLEG